MEQELKTFIQTGREMSAARANATLLLKAAKLALLEFDRISYQIKADPAVIDIIKQIVAKAEAAS